jgi:hypothetical protein
MQKLAYVLMLLVAFLRVVEITASLMCSKSCWILIGYISVGFCMLLDSVRFHQVLAEFDGLYM